jgi:hypothetical protein
MGLQACATLAFYSGSQSHDSCSTGRRNDSNRTALSSKRELLYTSLSTSKFAIVLRGTLSQDDIVDTEDLPGQVRDLELLKKD